MTFVAHCTRGYMSVDPFGCSDRSFSAEKLTEVIESRSRFSTEKLTEVIESRSSSSAGKLTEVIENRKMNEGARLLKAKTVTLRTLKVYSLSAPKVADMEVQLLARRVLAFPTWPAGPPALLKEPPGFMTWL